MADIGTAYVKIEPTAKGISSKISGMMESEGKGGGESFSKGFGSVLGGIGKAAVGAVAAGAAAVGGIVSAAVSNFGEYEQLVGGVETLFGDAANTVIKNADAAFQTAGLSANQYMQTVTSFSASLLQSVGGDTAEAAKVADMALIDMADNANKMGTSMESIQNAYQGFAKQNYTMLDNLKLGYGGTKSEMERLLADAEKLTGVKYDISNLNDVYNAIHAVQENLGITGTTAKEASETIQGSMAAMKSAWQNVLTGMATDGANMDTLIEQLINTVETFAGNIMPVVETALTGVSTLVERVAPVLAERIPAIITEALPGLLQSGVKVIESLASGILAAIPSLMPTITSVIMQLVQMLVQMAPQLISVGAQVILELASGIAQALPELIPTIVDVILTIVEYLLDNIDLVIDAAMALMEGLALGLINALPKLIEKAPIIIEKLVSAIISNIPKLIECAAKLVLELASAIIKNLPQIVKAAGEIIGSLVSGIANLISKVIDSGKKVIESFKEGLKKLDPREWGKDLLNNFIQGIKDKIGDLKDACKDIAEKVKDILGFSEPKEGPLSDFHTYAPDMMELFAQGIKQNEDIVQKQLEQSFDLKPYQEVMYQSTATNSYEPVAPAQEDGMLAQIESLLTKYLPNIGNDLVLDTGALVGGTTNKYNDALGRLAVIGATR